MSTHRSHGTEQVIDLYPLEGVDYAADYEVAYAYAKLGSTFRNKKGRRVGKGSLGMGARVRLWYMDQSRSIVMQYDQIQKE